MDSQEQTSPDENLKQLITEARSLADESNFIRKVNGRLYGEIGELAKFLMKMQTTLQSTETSVGETANELPAAANELAGITHLTEEGTHRIMEYAETVMENQGEMKVRLAQLRAALGPALSGNVEAEEAAARIEALVDGDNKIMMDLIMALEFQDLAGQRLKKAAATLQEVQSRLLKLIVTFGIESGRNAVTPDKQETLLSELSASSKAERMDQNLVDGILKEFGF